MQNNQESGTLLLSLGCTAAAASVLQPLLCNPFKLSTALHKLPQRMASRNTPKLWAEPGNVSADDRCFTGLGTEMATLLLQLQLSCFSL